MGEEKNTVSLNYLTCADLKIWQPLLSEEWYEKTFLIKACNILRAGCSLWKNRKLQVAVDRMTQAVDAIQVKWHHR